jgi:signal peptidase II
MPSSPSSTRCSTPKSRASFALLLPAAGLIALDQLSKNAAQAVVGGVRTLAGCLRLDFVRNAMGPLGFLPDSVRPGAMLLLSAAFLALLSLARRRELLGRAPFVLGWAGALGNGLDWLRFGAVRDFLALPMLPIFNLADVYLCCGIALGTLHLLRGEAKPCTRS